jgi:hypothetical protein
MATLPTWFLYGKYKDADDLAELVYGLVGLLRFGNDAIIRRHATSPEWTERHKPKGKV